MKKLMTMIAAVGMAFGLFADTNLGTSFEGTDFEVGPITAVTAAEKAQWTVPSGATADVALYGEDAKVTGDNRPAAFTGDQLKYLNVKTTLGSPIVRAFENGGWDLTTGKVFFDGLVKFTNFDSAPESIDGKIAVWVQEIENEDETITTNLMVTAGSDKNGTPANYLVWSDYAPTLNGGWSRVTIKAIPTILADEKTAPVPGFVVWVDGALVGATESKTAIDGTGYTLSNIAKSYNNEGNLFLSMDQSTENISIIKGVAFDGQGQIDDVLLTDVVPNVPQAADPQFFFITAGDNVESIKVDGAEYTFGDPLLLGQLPYEFTVTPTYASGFIDGVWTATEGATADAANHKFTVTAGGATGTVVAKAALVKVGDKYFSTLAEAFNDPAALKAADGEVTLKGALTLDSTVTIPTVDGVDAVVLDLAGKTITYEDDETFAFTASAPLVIKDSSEEQTGTIDAAKAVQATAALTVEGGIIKGELEFSVMTISGGAFTMESLTWDEVGDFEISGGTFDDEVGEEFAYPDQVVTGKVAAYNDGAKYWEITEKPSAGFVIQLVGNVQQSGDAESGYTFTCDNNMKMFINGVEQASAASFKPATWYDEKQYVVVSEVLPAEAVPEHKWFEKAAGRNLGVVAKVGPFAKVGNGEGPVGGADQEFFGVCGGTGSGWAKLVTKANIAANAADGVYTVAYDAAVACKLRGGAVCKKLNTFLAFGDGAGKMMSLPLNAEEVVFAEDATLEKPQNAFLIDEPCAMSEGAFSTDGQYLWAVNEDKKAVTKRDTISLYKINKGLKGDGEGHFTWVRDVVVNSAGARMIKVANVNGKDVVYCMLAGTAGIQAFDATVDAPVVQTIIPADVLTDNTYGAINVVDSSDAAPHLTIYTCKNGGYGIDSASKLIVYTLAADGLSKADVDPIEWTVPELAEEAIGFGGPIGRHCLDLFASENEKTMYIAMSVFDNGTADGSGRTYIFQVESCEYVDFILNDEKATDTSVTNMYRKAAVIAEAPAPATQENFVGWFTDSTKETAAVFPLTLNADTELWAKYEAAPVGPQPTGLGAGSVEPVPDEPGVYVVKGDASSHNVSIDPNTLKTTDKIRVCDSDIGKITGVPANQIEIKLNGVTTAIDQKYFEGGDEKGFSLELSDEAKATLVEETEDDKPLVIGDDVDVTINTVAGLKYQLVRGTEVGTIETAIGDPVVGDGSALTLTDDDKPEGKAFYVIKTSK